MKPDARLRAVIDKCASLHPTQFAVIDRAMSALVAEAHTGKRNLVRKIKQLKPNARYLQDLDELLDKHSAPPITND